MKYVLGEVVEVLTPAPVKGLLRFTGAQVLLPHVSTPASVKEAMKSICSVSTRCQFQHPPP